MSNKNRTNEFTASHIANPNDDETNMDVTDLPTISTSTIFGWSDGTVSLINSLSII